MDMIPNLRDSETTVGSTSGIRRYLGRYSDKPYSDHCCITVWTEGVPRHSIEVRDGGRLLDALSPTDGLDDAHAAGTGAGAAAWQTSCWVAIYLYKYILDGYRGLSNQVARLNSEG